MNLLDKLERKIGWLAVPNLMFYIVIGNAMVYITQMLTGLDLTYTLAFHLPSVLQGQVWRIFSFVLIPPTIFTGGIWSLFVAALAFLFYFSIGRQLENAMGTFAFTLFYLLGMLCVIVTGSVFSVPLTGTYLNSTLFFAYAFYYPDNQILVMYVIPVKVKYIAYFSAAVLAFNFVTSSWLGKILTISGLLNFFIFFGKPLLLDRMLRYRRKQRYAAGQGFARSRQHSKFKVYTNPYAQSAKKNTRHCCEVCGRSELDDPNLEFRYCSVCEGYHEYCMEHLHQHIHKKSGEA
ncbi:hypothetical protein EII17_05735 [Clostridiales bacterium COT073_COT-073]|nr:hypothetical protein EII17_05735 [Clostridiales bacterium COT073_COT-073]